MILYTVIKYSTTFSIAKQLKVYFGLAIRLRNLRKLSSKFMVFGGHGQQRWTDK